MQKNNLKIRRLIVLTHFPGNQFYFELVFSGRAGNWRKRYIVVTKRPVNESHLCFLMTENSKEKGRMKVKRLPLWFRKV